MIPWLLANTTVGTQACLNVSRIVRNSVHNTLPCAHCWSQDTCADGCVIAAFVSAFCLCTQIDFGANVTLRRVELNKPLSSTYASASSALELRFGSTPVAAAGPGTENPVVVPGPFSVQVWLQGKRRFFRGFAQSWSCNKLTTTGWAHTCRPCVTLAARIVRLGSLAALWGKGCCPLTLVVFIVFLDRSLAWWRCATWRAEARLWGATSPCAQPRGHPLSPCARWPRTVRAHTTLQWIAMSSVNRCLPRNCMAQRSKLC